MVPLQRLQLSLTRRSFLFDLIAGLGVRRGHLPGRGEPRGAAPLQRQGRRRAPHGKQERDCGERQHDLGFIVRQKMTPITSLKIWIISPVLAGGYDV